MKRNTQALLVASREIGLGANIEKTISCHQNAVQNYSLLLANKSFENVAEF
jgi:hypothetical protein